MKQYLQHNNSYQIAFRSPKSDSMLCSDKYTIFKKEIYYEYIS